MPSKKHIHTYERRAIPKGMECKQVYYRCIDPDCSHRIVREDLFGKRATCPYCGEPYILDPRKLRAKLPHCGCKNLNDEQREDIKIDPSELLTDLMKLKQEKFNAVSE
jgi:hypothetical protein